VLAGMGDRAAKQGTGHALAAAHASRRGLLGSALPVVHALAATDNGAAPGGEDRLEVGPSVRRDGQ